MEIDEVDGRLSAIQAEYLNDRIIRRVDAADKAILYTLIICASLLSIIARKLSELNDRSAKQTREMERQTRMEKRR